MRTRRFARGYAALCVAAVVAAGCAVREAEQRPPASPAQARVGGTLEVGVGAPGAFEPTFASSPSGLLISSTVCDTLVHIEPGTGEVKPGLAESWTVTDRGMTITFKLRPDLRFHGTSDTLTSQDVVFSLTRLADPEEGSYLAGLVESIVGWEEFRDTENPAATLIGVQAIDEHAVQVQLTTGDSDAIRLFAHPAAAPVSEDAVDANPLLSGRQPICVGPYELSEPAGQDATEIRLVRDPNYAGEALAYTGGGEGYADEIVFSIYDDDVAAYSAWKQGDVDVAWVPSAQVGKALRESPEDVVQGPAPYVEFVGVPATAVEGTVLAGFNQIAVRRALSLALDRTRIANNVYGEGRSPATGFVPPSAISDEPHGCAATVPAKADVQKAQDLLESSGVKLDGRRVPFYFNNELGNDRLVHELGAQWREALGLRIEPRPVPWDKLLDRSGQGTGVGGLFRVSWTSQALSVEDYLRPLVSDDVEGPNLARFSSPAAERAIFELDNADSGDRLLTLNKLEEIVCSEVPAIPVVFGRSSWAVGASKVGFARDRVIGMNGLLLLRELYIR